MLTLIDLADNIVLDAEIVIVNLWHEDTNRYDLIFRFDDCDDLGDKLHRSTQRDLPTQEYLKYEVQWVGAEVFNGKSVLRIEIQAPEDRK